MLQSASFTGSDLMDLRDLPLQLHLLLELELLLEFFLLLPELLLDLLEKSGLAEIELFRLLAGHHELARILLL